MANRRDANIKFSTGDGNPRENPVAKLKANKLKEK